MQKTIKIALVGYGYWGRNLARIVNNSEQCLLCAVIEISDRNLSEIKTLYPNVAIYKNHLEISNEDDIDAVIVATPVDTHYQIVKHCLLCGKHVLCEKVLSTDMSEILFLKKLAIEKNKILMAGFTFIYNAIVKYMKAIIQNGDCGEILYVTCKRTGLGPIRSDVDVIYDLATHDLSILINLIGKPIYVQLIKNAILNKSKADVAFIQAAFENSVIADIQVSWLSPMKQRIIEVVGTKQMLIFDDVSTFEKLKIIKTGRDYQSMIKDFASFQLSVKDGDIIIPSIYYPEPLKEEIDDFINCILSGNKPQSDIQLSIDIAEAFNLIKKH